MNQLIRILGFHRFLRSIMIALLCLPISIRASTPFTHRLQTELASGKSPIPVIIRFRDYPDLSKFRQRTIAASQFIDALQTTNARSKINAVALIRSADPVAPILTLWIDNSIATLLSPQLINRIATLPEVESIDLDACDAKPVTSSSAPAHLFPDETQTIIVGWNLMKTGVDSVWLQYGLDGTGITIGTMDTGVDTTHPALHGHMRDGAGNWFDAVNFRPNPYDDVGHGTGTIGVVIGGDGPGSFDHDIGIAYNAKFIATKMLSSGGSTPNGAVINAAQWILDPDQDPATNDFPAIATNSWYSGTRGSTWFARSAQAWYTAGIIPVFCAGNEGPGEESTTSPGDYVTCLSIGGTNSDDGAYAATSIGPSAMGPEFPHDLHKPDFSAPGQAVVSATKPAGYSALSGTSFAAPHASGIIALMLQAAPGLNFDQIKKLLALSATDLGASGYDFTFGNGRLNALKAVRYALGTRVHVSPDTVTTLTDIGLSTDFSYVLSVQPASTVTIAFRQSDPVRLTLNKTSLTFTHQNWNQPQSLRATHTSAASQDTIIVINAAFASNDPMFNRILIPPQLITLIHSGTTDVAPATPKPEEFTLQQNFPNPFNPSTVMRFTLAEQATVSLNVYDLTGREIATLLQNQSMTPGEHSVQFSADGIATSLPSGVYYYSLHLHSAAQSRILTRSMLFIK